MGSAQSTDWQAIVKEKRAEREAKLPIKWKIETGDLPSDDVTDVIQLCRDRKWLTDTELIITESTMVELAAAIKNKEYTAVQVVEAFAHRATIAQQLINCLTEINFDAAMEEAARQDAHLQATGQVVGPLHGMPISVKDQWHVEGLDTTMGYCAWAGRIAHKDSVLVACLRTAGAIILTKTNVGHTLMMGESINHLWGRTVNPFNRTLTPGGSSGGEAALLALRGSAIGVGTDIGGSIRKPANLCGLWALRPSVGRVSMREMSDCMVGQEAVRNAGGPLAHSAKDLALFMSAYFAQKPWDKDPGVYEMPWKTDIAAAAKRSYCFAIAWGDEVVTPHPPILRGLRHVVKALKAAGHTVVDWQGPLGGAETQELMGQFWSADGGEEVMKQVNASGEPMYPEVAKVFNMKPGDTKYHPLSVNKTWQNQQRRTLHAQWFADTWKATASYSGTKRPIDGLICPTQSTVAAPHVIGMPNHKPTDVYYYASLEPLLDLSSGAFPSGLCQDPKVDLPAKNFEPRSDLDGKINALYHDPQEWANAPIGFQITAQRLEEEKVVDMLCCIEDALAAQKD